MPHLLDPNLEKALQRDKEYLEKSKVPIVTVSATFKEDLKGFHGWPEDDDIPDVVFSRAHYSMAAGTAVQAWGKKITPSKAWVIDPTNYVSEKDWRSIEITEYIGKTLARYPFLKKLKDFVDKFGRSKLPILSGITPPLLYLTEHVSQPILSFHIAAGNVLAAHGKKVVQVVTDPHVRDEYLNHADKAHFYLCVFDERTKTDVLEKASLMGKVVDPATVIVTGPPIDPRIIAARHKKKPWRNGPLKMCLTTGGLGTNKHEMENILRQVLPNLSQPNCHCHFMVYAGTHQDICDSVKQIAKEAGVKVGKPADVKAKLRLLYHPQIVDTNELLIKYAFPWADGFITKPSGDMGYDAPASGSFVLTLREWGVWEQNVKEVFEQLGVAREAQVDNIVAQMKALTNAEGKSQSWVEKAMNKAHNLNKLFIEGSANILDVVEKVRD